MVYKKGGLDILLLLVLVCFFFYRVVLCKYYCVVNRLSCVLGLYCIKSELLLMLIILIKNVEIQKWME